NLIGRSGTAIVPAVIAFYLGATHVTDALFWVIGVVMLFGGASSVGIELLSVPLIQERRALGHRAACDLVGTLSMTMIHWGAATTVVFGLISALLVMGVPIVHHSATNYAIGYLFE